MSQALALAAHLAYYSVADKTLLATKSPHSDLSDYADITRYLTPRALRYLKSYIVDQNRNWKHFLTAAQLALANVNYQRNTPKSRTGNSHGIRFGTPFRPHDYRATINPKVGLGQDHTTMIVTGSCSVTVPGIRNSIRYQVTLKRLSFTYYIRPTPSAAYPVGLSGWQSSSTATYRRR